MNRKACIAELSLGTTTTIEYDTYDRQTTTTDHLGNKTVITYGTNDQVIAVTDPMGNTTDYNYSTTTGLLSSVTDAEGGVISYEYDWAGKLVKLTDQRGHNTTYAYDVFGRLRSETNPLNQTTSYAYDDAHGCGSCGGGGGGGNGNLGSVTDPAGRSTHYAYDAADRLTTVTYSGSSDMVVHTYDEHGRRVATFDNRLPTADFPTQTFTWTYDKFDRMLTETYSDGEVVAWTYDVNGRRMSLTDPDGNVTKYYYNDLPDNKKLAALSHPISDNLYVYNDRGLLESDEIWYPGSYEWMLSMQPLSRSSQNLQLIAPMAHEFDLKLKTEMFYDPLNRLDEQIYYHNIDPVVVPYTTAVHTYNKASLRESTSYQPGWSYSYFPQHSNAYNYDKTGRLIREERVDGADNVEWANSFEYDLAGNRTKQLTFNGTSTGTISYQYNAFNQVEDYNAPADHFSYLYDACGNLQFRVDNGRMLYRDSYHDRQNRLIGMYDDLTPRFTAYVYDFSGRLIMRTEHNGNKEKYYYDGINRLLVRERPHTQNPTCERTKEVYFLKEASIGQVVARLSYTYSPVPGDCTEGMSYKDVTFHYDPVGNVIAELLPDAGPVNRVDMDAFGTIRSGGYAGPRLTSKQYDLETGVYYFGARWYDPMIAQWIQKDPIFTGHPYAPAYVSQVAVMPQLKHLYGFNINRPTSFVDPDGMLPQWLPPGGLGGGIIGGVVGGAWGCATSMWTSGSCACGAVGGAISGVLGGALGGAVGGAIGGGLGGCAQGACQCAIEGGGAGASVISCLGSGAVGMVVGGGIGALVPGLPNVDAGAAGTAGGTAAGGAAGAVFSPSCGCGK